MKKNNLYIALGFLILLSSCDSFLNREPLSDLSPSSYFKDKAEMSNWNAGIYDAFQKTLSKGQIQWGDVRSDSYHTTSYANTKMYMNALDSQMGECSWKDLYNCISLCNVGIQAYPTIPSILETEYAPYIAQCYGMRAYMYFWGTRVWGKMPKISEPWDGNLSSIAVKRASLEEIKELILSDIEKALSYFGADVSNKYGLTAAAMYALKTDVYMWYNEYEEALKASDYFIGNSNYELADGELAWKEIFTKPSSSKEVIFAMHWDFESDGANSGWSSLIGASNTNNGLQISQDIFIELIDRLYSGEGSDSRLWNTVDTVKLYYSGSRMPLTYAHYSSSGIEKCIKYSAIDPNREYDSSNKVYKSYYGVLNTSDCQQHLVMYRLGNILLLRAEALNQLGRGGEALAIVNDIRKRVGYLKDATLEVSDVLNKKEVEDVILLERQLELFGEGCRWFDLMRTGHLISVMNSVYIARQEAAGVMQTGFGDEGSKYWPIYYREFESNKALSGDQNPPYSER